MYNFYSSSICPTYSSESRDLDLMPYNRTDNDNNISQVYTSSNNTAVRVPVHIIPKDDIMTDDPNIFSDICDAYVQKNQTAPLRTRTNRTPKAAEHARIWKLTNSAPKSARR